MTSRHSEWAKFGLAMGLMIMIGLCVAGFCVASLNPGAGVGGAIVVISIGLFLLILSQVDC